MAGRKKAPGGRLETRRVKHRLFPVHFAPGKRLFHVIVRLSDAPGSFSLILNRLRLKLNLIGTSTYSLSDGTAIFSGFAEALSPGETAEGIRKLALGSKGAIEAEVKEGRDGLLIDTFHIGFEVDGDDFVLMRSRGVGQMFDRVSGMLGSGGDALLYEEGLAMGKWNAETLIKKIGVRRAKAQAGALGKSLSAQGLGEIEGDVGPSGGTFNMKVNGCFECAGEGTRRKGCHFMRGYFSGSAEALYGKRFEVEEPRCVLRGAKYCEFQVSPAEKA